MRIVKDTPDTLSIEERSTFFRAAGYGTFIFLTLAAVFYFYPAEWDPDRVYGMLATAAFCAVMYTVFYENNRFEFGHNSQWLRWSRYHFFRRKSGQLPFSEIENVVLQTQMGDHAGTPSRRIVLQTVKGDILLTIGYKPDTRLDATAQRIRDVLTMPQETLTSDSIAALVKSGRTIEAVRMLRDAEGLSLTQAKARVDSMKVGEQDDPAS